MQHVETFIINSFFFIAALLLAVMAVVMLVANMQDTEGNVHVYV